MKAVLMEDDVHELLVKVAKQRKVSGNYCRKMKDIIAEEVKRLYKRECGG